MLDTVTRIPKMRTIHNAYLEIKKMDDGCNISENLIRKIVKTGKIKTLRSGRKVLVDLYSLIDCISDAVNEPATEIVEAKQPSFVKKLETIA